MKQPSESPGLNLRPIGLIRSCYQQNFSIPRQPGLAKSALSVLILNSCDDLSPGEMTEGLEYFSHLWVIFQFHQLKENAKFNGKVRPPRLGGEKKIGSLASRSPYRPNPIGLSAVEIVSISSVKKEVRILAKGGDFLDETPLLDIKPYLPYSDIKNQAVEHFPTLYANDKSTPVVIAPQVSELLFAEGHQLADTIKETLIQTLSTDPRPSWKKRNFPRSENHRYHSIFYGIDFAWKIENGTITVHQARMNNPEILTLFKG